MKYTKEELQLIEDTEDAMRPLMKRKCPQCEGLGHRMPKGLKLRDFAELTRYTCEGCRGSGKIIDNEEAIKGILPRGWDLDDYRFYKRFMEEKD